MVFSTTKKGQKRARHDSKVLIVSKEVLAQSGAKLLATTFETTPDNDEFEELFSNIESILQRRVESLA